MVISEDEQMVQPLHVSVNGWIQTHIFIAFKMLWLIAELACYFIQMELFLTNNIKSVLKKRINTGDT